MPNIVLNIVRLLIAYYITLVFSPPKHCDVFRGLHQEGKFVKNAPAIVAILMLKYSFEILNSILNNQLDFGPWKNGIPGGAQDHRINGTFHALFSLNKMYPFRRGSRV